jgi:hypothetical protein
MRSTAAKFSAPNNMQSQTAALKALDDPCHKIVAGDQVILQKD